MTKIINKIKSWLNSNKEFIKLIHEVMGKFLNHKKKKDGNEK